MGQHEEILKQDLFPIDGPSSGARLVPIDTDEQEPLTSLCLRMREKLETDHVICPAVKARELCQALREHESTVRAVLEDGFYKLLTIEVSRGLDTKGEFDHDGLFLPYLRQVLYTSFGVEPTDDFHPEQIAQVAKDEPRSLFCFLDAQHIQGPELQRLRIFTQTHHRVLLCAIPPIIGLPVRPSFIQDSTSERGKTPSDHALKNVGTKIGASRPVLMRANGIAAGKIIELKPDRVLIGRSPEHCLIVLDSHTVSRRHAEIYRKGDSFFLSDLNSQNGTRVKDSTVLPGNDHRLTPGDRINIGGVEFLYYHRFPSHSPTRVQGEVMVVDDRDDAQTRAEDLEFEMISNQPPEMANPEVKLKAILEIARNLSSELRIDAIALKILDSLMEIFPQSERLSVILLDPESKRLVCKAFKYRPTCTEVVPVEEVQMSISRSIHDHVLVQCRAFLTEHASSVSNLATSGSIADVLNSVMIRSEMYVPLLKGDREALGIIRIDTTDRKNFRQKDLDVLKAVATQAAIAIQNAAMHELLLERERQNCDSKFAEQVQKRFLPQAVPSIPGFEFFAQYDPAYDGGGNYYDFVPLPQNRVAVAVGDVSGKGLAAALMMAKFSGDTRFCILTENSPARAANRLNSLLFSRGNEDKFITLSLGVLDIQKRTLALSSAGHLPVMIRRANGTIDEIGEQIAGVPLGIMPESDYLQTEVKLNPGDVVTVFSDGVSNALRVPGEVYDSPEIRQLLRKVAETQGTPEAVGRGIFHDIRQFTGGRGLSDDITLICFGPVT
jgi:serine phosphatase RsbU (regulator of sigma subunit)